MFYDGFHSQCAGDFAVRLAAHAVGKDKKVQRLHQPKAVFIVRPNLPHVGRAAAHNAHKHSPSRAPGRTHQAGHRHSTLPKPPPARKAVRPTDYSQIDYTTNRIGYTVGPAGVARTHVEGKVKQIAQNAAKTQQKWRWGQA